MLAYLRHKIVKNIYSEDYFLKARGEEILVNIYTFIINIIIIIIIFFYFTTSLTIKILAINKK